MNRIAARILLFLLLGAVVNVAVAWGCALWAPLRSYGSTRWNVTLDADLARLVPEKWLAAPHGVDITVHEDRGFGSSVQTIAVDNVQVSDDHVYIVTKSDNRVYTHRCGWPAPALSCVVVADGWTWPGLNRPGNGLEWHAGLASPAWLRPTSPYPWSVRPFDHALPCAPLTAGFAVNTALYGALICGAPWWFLWLRRHRRTARGLCPHCAYPVGISPVCTECGRPLPAAARRKSVAQGVNPG